MSLPIAALTLLILGQNKKTPTPPYVGEWVTLQADGVQGKEDLKLAKDGTFTMMILVPNNPTHTAKGHFTAVPDEEPPGSTDKKDCTIYLTLENVDSAAVDPKATKPTKLGYYSKGPILTDTVAVVFCHPGDQAKITKMFTSKPKSGG